jgi:hypothetical protein
MNTWMWILIVIVFVLVLVWAVSRSRRKVASGGCASARHGQHCACNGCAMRRQRSVHVDAMIVGTGRNADAVSTSFDNMQIGLNDSDMQIGLNDSDMQIGLNDSDMQIGLNDGDMQIGLNDGDMQIGLNSSYDDGADNIARMRKELQKEFEYILPN